MVILVDLDNGVQPFLESFSIGRKANNREHDMSPFAGLVVPTYSVYLGRVSGVDAVARGRTCIASKNGEVGACDT